ncbi:ABC transporter substrate-binding protein [Acetomicrobium flavidum]|uniref:ABC transporter substrate-binding protein n=1 Tax=Acetomicrobium flavidum TaxID=49896 RepID=UPI002989FE03
MGAVVAILLILSAYLHVNARSNTLIYALFGDAVNMDPLGATDINSWKVMSQIYEGLMKFRPSSLEVEPCLASYYEVSDDGLVFTFYLQKNVQFQDGTPFDADAVIWNARRGMEKADTSYYADLVWGNVKAVEKLSRYVVRFTLKEPRADFLTNLALPFGGSMVSPNATDLKNNPIGTGPYRLTDWVRNKAITLAYNSNWWQSKLTDGVGFKSIRYLVVDDPEEAVNLLRQGKVHILSYVPPEQVESLNGEVNVRLEKTPLLGTSFLGFNTKSAVLADAKVRQSLLFLLDQDYLIKHVYNGLALRSQGPLPPALEKEIECRYLSPNYEVGVRLLQEAGYSKESPLHFTLEVPLEPRDYMPSGGVKLGEGLKEVYESTGLVKVTFVYKPFESLLKDLMEGKATEAFILGWSSDNGQADNMLTPLFHSKSPLNFFKYENSLVDKYLEEAQTELDENKREKLYRETCGILLKDAPAVFLPIPVSFKALDDRLRGYNINPINIEQLYFVRY